VLDVVGVGADAGAVYETLLDGRPASIDDLVGATGLAPQRLQAALHTLKEHGLISQVSGSSARYAAADPGIALDVLLLEREEQIKRARIHAQELTERFHRAAARRDPAELVEVVTGRHAVLQRVEQAQRSARHQQRAFDKPPYANIPNAPDEPATDLLRRGGIVRNIYERASIEIPGRLTDHIGVGVALGEQARMLPEVPVKLVLVDDRTAVIPLQAAPTAIESAVIVHQSALLEAISALFETLWQLAIPLELGSGDVGLPDRATAEESRILALLTAGLPDEAIARQLGLSDRTYQRRMRDLMERLHVQTRFQLARQAARRGWLDDGPGAGR
jgi:DNA-binding CsgD family transcriptional regulator/sugar-specific transcriptional regulator TrmB